MQTVFPLLENLAKVGHFIVFGQRSVYLLIGRNSGSYIPWMGRSSKHCGSGSPTE